MLREVNVLKESRYLERLNKKIEHHINKDDI